MGNMQDKVTRFSADLVEAAAAEGARQSRSARQQLDHWVRVGRAVTSVATAQRMRVEAALAGALPMRELTTEERVVANAEISAAIEEKVASTSFGRELADEGITTVALDEHGNLVEYRPDGSTVVVDVP
jgi:hypothetical protein